MHQVDPPHRPRSAAAFDELDPAERAVFARQVERDVERSRRRVVRHRPQALESTGARAEPELHAFLRNHPFSIRRAAAFLIDVYERLITRIVRSDALAALAIDFPEYRELAPRVHRLSPVNV